MTEPTPTPAETPVITPMAVVVLSSYARGVMFEDAVNAPNGTMSVDVVPTNPIGTTARDVNGNLFMYLRGVTLGTPGLVVTYDADGVTTPLAVDAKGFVAVMGGPLVNGSYGWCCIDAPLGVPVMVAANCLANALVGREGTDGIVGDGRAAGDQIHNFITRGATAGVNALTMCQFSRPFVDDAYGT